MAYARHYPAIDWNQSYSEYIEDLSNFYNENVGADFMSLRQEISNILQEETKLMEIVKLIGADVLPDDQKLSIETARVVRVGFLQQNAYHKEDTYVPLEKQRLMMKVIVKLYHKSLDALKNGVMLSDILGTGLFDKVVKIKYDIPNDKLEMFDDYLKEIDKKIDGLTA